MTDSTNAIYGYGAGSDPVVPPDFEAIKKAKQAEKEMWLAKLKALLEQLNNGQISPDKLSDALGEMLQGVDIVLGDVQEIQDANLGIKGVDISKNNELIKLEQQLDQDVVDAKAHFDPKNPSGVYKDKFLKDLTTLKDYINKNYSANDTDTKNLLDTIDKTYNLVKDAKVSVSWNSGKETHTYVGLEALFVLADRAILKADPSDTINVWIPPGERPVVGPTTPTPFQTDPSKLQELERNKSVLNKITDARNQTFSAEWQEDEQVMETMLETRKKELTATMTDVIRQMVTGFRPN